MKTVIVENTRISREIMDFGWGNGYVVIPIGHALHGKHYDAIDVNAHGGLTYSREVAEPTIRLFGLEDSDLGSWMVGFDTYHLDDSLEKWGKEAVQAEADRLLEQLKNYVC